MLNEKITDIVAEKDAANQVPTLKAAKNYIYSINFDQIIEKMVSHNGWSQKNALQVCQLYRNFLFLNKKYGKKFGQLPPSEDVDEFWHNHILDTKKYMQDCQFIFGNYFHHYPYLGIDGDTNMQDLAKFFETTQQLHFKEFGDYIYEVRGGILKRFFQFAKSILVFSKTS